VAAIINQLRIDLQKNGFVFGCLFMAERHADGLNFGIFFPDRMPADYRLGMLDDLQAALTEARKL
jgi:hypothetical protein